MRPPRKKNKDCVNGDYNWEGVCGILLQTDKLIEHVLVMPAEEISFAYSIWISHPDHRRSTEQIWNIIPAEYNNTCVLYHESDMLQIYQYNPSNLLWIFCMFPWCRVSNLIFRCVGRCRYLLLYWGCRVGQSQHGLLFLEFSICTRRGYLYRPHLHV